MWLLSFLSSLAHAHSDFLTETFCHTHRSSTCDAGTENDDRASYAQLQVPAVARIVEWDGRSAKDVAQPAAVLCQVGGYLKQRLRLLLVWILEAVTEITKTT